MKERRRPDEAESLRAKKSLGQHFLNARSFLAAMADAAGVQSGDLVLEVGPGKGSLTREILSLGARVIAIEKDHRMLPLLTREFANHIEDGSLRLVEGDALDADLRALGLAEGEYKAVANIPYYITGALLRRLLGEEPRPSTAALLLQKEVARRITDKRGSLLSMSVQAYGSPRYVKTVPRGAFSPPPSVDSAILAIENISVKNFPTPEAEICFFELLRAGFAHPRKLLARNLEELLGKEPPERLKKADIAAKARAEEVSLEQWLALARLRNGER